MLLVDPIPGHEERNVEFLLNNGLALAVTKTFPVDEAVYNLFTNPGRIENIRAVMATVAHPDATARLADIVLENGTPAPAGTALPEETECQ